MRRFWTLAALAGLCLAAGQCVEPREPVAAWVFVAVAAICAIGASAALPRRA